MGLVINFCSLFGGCAEFRDAQLCRAIRNCCGLTQTLLGISSRRMSRDEARYAERQGRVLQAQYHIDAIDQHFRQARDTMSRNPLLETPAENSGQPSYLAENYYQRICLVHNLAVLRAGWVHEVVESRRLCEEAVVVTDVSSRW